MIETLADDTPYGTTAMSFEARIIVKNQGRTVIQLDQGRFEAERLEIEVITDGQAFSRTVDPDFVAWRAMSISERARLVESYVAEVLRKSGYLDVIGDTKV